MIAAVRRGHVDVVRTLVECGAEKNNHDSNGATPLLEAIKRNNLDIVFLLVEARADIEFMDGYGATPLNFASRKGIHSYSTLTVPTLHLPSYCSHAYFLTSSFHSLSLFFFFFFIRSHEHCSLSVGKWCHV